MTTYRIIKTGEQARKETASSVTKCPMCGNTVGLRGTYRYKRDGFFRQIKITTYTCSSIVSGCGGIFEKEETK
jgi:C4-type Zn-finger protein